MVTKAINNTVPLNVFCLSLPSQVALTPDPQGQRLHPDKHFHNNVECAAWKLAL